MEIKLLDCTLRDGGYVNNWGFSFDEYKRVIDGLSLAHIDCIEVGIMGKDSSAEYNTKFCSYDEVPRIERKGKQIYSVMTTVGESEGLRIPRRNERSVDAIRVAFFKPDTWKIKEIARDIKSKGYLLFLQAMASFMYSEDELKILLELVEDVSADVFYLVDSFGMLYPDSVRNMARVVHHSLNASIPIGFHAHNNIQLAFANDIAFIEEMDSLGRECVYVDGTVYGMGRGAGNTPTELLAGYLNDRWEGVYDIGEIQSVYKDVIRKMRIDYSWGYDYLYYLSSINRVNMAYIWYLKEIRGIKDEDIIGKILADIPDERRYTLDMRLVDGLVEEMGI